MRLRDLIKYLRKNQYLAIDVNDNVIYEYKHLDKIDIKDLLDLEINEITTNDDGCDTPVLWISLKTQKLYLKEGGKKE